jgi:hypothetical protein
MRLHPLTIVLSIPAIFLACSSGGPGSAPSPGGSNAFGQPGATVPALSPITPSTGGQTPEPEFDSGNPQDTNPRDTGVVDTGSTADTGGDICSKPSTCSADPAPDVTTCQTNLASTCGSLWLSYYQCVDRNRTCTVDGVTDTAALSSACSSEISALSTCAG